MHCSLLRGLAASLLLLAGGVSARTTVDTFNGNVNEGAWSFGVPPSLVGSNGNPGGYVSGFPDTFAPQCRSGAGPTNPFHGDWRSRGVTSVGADFRVFSTNFGYARECTLILSAGTVQVYTIHADPIPQIAQGWRSFDFDVPSAQLTLPAGWTVHPNSSVQDGDAAWNAVMQGVTQVNYFFGHPEFFYIFDQWLVGVDNARIADAENTFEDVGGGTSGLGTPTLLGDGTLGAHSPMDVQLTGAVPGSLALLWGSVSSAPLSAFGGTIHANPFVVQSLVVTDASGALPAMISFPGAPSGTSFWLQFLCADAGSPYGITLSNAVKGTVP